MPTVPVADLVDLARLAEDLGYHRCWVYDEGLATRDVYLTLGAIAQATTALRLGTGITNPYVRHPGATAAAIATLDEISGGRAFLGLGAGGGLTLSPLAIERRRPVTAVRDTINTVRALFRGETVEHQGETFSFHRARLDYARPDIEIFLAGRGPKMTELGGTLADGFNLSYIHKELLGDHVTALRSAAGSRPFTITYSTMVVSDEADMEEARAALTFRLVDSPAEVKDRIGMSNDDTEAIRNALTAGGPSAAAVHIKPEWVPQFVLTGSPADAGAELRRLLTSHGIDEFQLPVQDPAGAAGLIERTAAMLMAD